MATHKTELEVKNQELNHLGFVRVATIHALVCVSSLYEYAKQNLGPLRSTVGTVEGAVTTVVGPVYEKFKGVPDHLLVFVDNKVDEATHKFNEHAPPLAKQVASQTRCLMQKASEKAQNIVREARTGGPRAAVYYAAKEYKHFVVNQTVRLCIVLDQCPPIHKAAEKAAPTAAHMSEKYNHTVKDLTQKGYPIFGYLPLIPIDEIAKTFKQGEAEKKGDSADSPGNKSSSDSDSD